MTATRRVIDDELHAHFVTFGVDHRRRLLDHDQPNLIVLRVLAELVERLPARCVGFVLMPDHVHAIVWFPQPGRLTRFMHEWKRQSSFHIRRWYRAEAPHYFVGFGEGNKFWQPKYHSFEIYGREKLEEKLRYMHENPVRAGFVAKATVWRWSSARWYESRQPVGVPIEWVE